MHTDAHALSRFLPNIDSYLEMCTEKMTMDTLQAVELSIFEQQVNNINWITAFTTNQNVSEGDMKPINSFSTNTISCDEMALAQKENTEISKVIKWIESKERPTSEQTSHESRDTGTSFMSGTNWNWTNMDYFGEKVA